MEDKNYNNKEDLIVAYLSGNANRQDIEALKVWLNESSENRKYFLQRQEIWFSSISEKESSLYDVNKAFELFRNKTERRGCQEKEKSFRRFPLFFRYVAVVAILLAISMSHMIFKIMSKPCAKPNKKPYKPAIICLKPR